MNCPPYGLPFRNAQRKRLFKIHVFASSGRFQADNPGINVQVENIPYGEIEPKLFTGLAAGVAPDVVALSYNTIARLVEQDLLVPPDFSLLSNVEDILPQALQTNFFNNVLYALPWRRQACSPNYLALALPRPSSQRYDVASRLINHLAGYEAQLRNFKEAGWYPVRQSVYNDAGLECPPVTAILLEAQFVQPTISLVADRQAQIAGVIGAVQLNPNLATAWVQDGKTRVAAEPLRFPVPQQQVDEQFYGGNGLPIGALFVDSSPEIKPGDYAVTCRADGDWAICDLVDPNGEKTTVKPADFARTPAPVGQPFVLLEQGSFRKCWYFDSLKICINIG